MSNPSKDPSGDVLVEGPKQAEKPAESVISQVANSFGVHPLRQLKDILMMRMGAQKLGSNEYYDLQIFDPAYDKKAKREFLGQGGINALNLAINPDTLMKTKNIVGNKLVYTGHLKTAGIPTTKTQAFISTTVMSDQDFVLSDFDTVVAFMREKAVFPIFGKPLGGSLSVGAVRIDKMEGDTLHLRGGGTVSVDRFATDILRVYADGYLLQSALIPHEDILKITGDVIGALRIVTTHDGTGIKPAYAVWKIPAPSAISDNSWQEGTMLALVDLADGTVLSCHRGKGPSAELLQNHPATGAQVVGFQFPYWQDILTHACSAHGLFPDLGICGFDVAVTDNGPVILECNDNPNHLIYQYSARRGVRNAELNPVWKSLIKRQKKAA